MGVGRKRRASGTCRSVAAGQEVQCVDIARVEFDAPADSRVPPNARSERAGASWGARRRWPPSPFTCRSWRRRGCDQRLPALTESGQTQSASADLTVKACWCCPGNRFKKVQEMDRPSPPARSRPPFGCDLVSPAGEQDVGRARSTRSGCCGHPSATARKQVSKTPSTA